MTRSRRALLAGCGATLAALAGCSGLDLDGEARTYDAERLAAVGESTPPRPPATFPVSVPPTMRRRHRERARALVDRVPADPDVPNGAVVQRLRHERREVLDALEGEGDDNETAPEDPLDRLGQARHVRADAAAVGAAYRAATRSIAAGAIEDRREALRSDLVAFESDWTYRGERLAPAVVVHRALEGLRREVRRGVRAERAFPADPAAAVFRVGEIVRGVEDGRAALTDAERLRARYRTGLEDGRPLRTRMSVAGSRLRWLGRYRHREVHEYLDYDAEALPFERNVGGTPLEELHRETAAMAERNGEGVEESRRRGLPATALVDAAVNLASIETLDRVVTAIREGALEAPTSAGDVAAERRTAVDRLEAAWEVEPTVLAVEIARPATYLVRSGVASLGGRFGDEGPPTERDATRAFADFARATHYAAAVPPTMRDVREAFASSSAG